MKRADSRSRSTEAELHSSWMLSFGDLLTLLLCFFLCILSFSPLNPHRPSEDIDKHNQIVALSAAELQGGGSVPGQTGTALAELQAEAREFGTLAKVSNSNELVLTLSDSDFAGGGWEATPAVLSRVKSQVIETSYAVLGVKVESCFPERGRAEEAA